MLASSNKQFITHIHLKNLTLTGDDKTDMTELSESSQYLKMPFISTPVLWRIISFRILSLPVIPNIFFKHICHLPFFLSNYKVGTKGQKVSLVSPPVKNKRKNSPN